MSHLEELEALDPLSNTNQVNVRIEMPTPHKVAVLILIQQYLKVKKEHNYPTQYRRNFCMLLLKLIQYPDMTYNDLHNLITSKRYKISTGHLLGFEKAMSDLFSQGIESLFDLSELHNIEKMLSEELGVSQFSIVGLYIRRVGVVLERLCFPEMKTLYKNICSYYDKGLRKLSVATNRTDRTSQSASSCQSQTSVHSDKTIVDQHIYEPAVREESIMDTETVHVDRNPLSKWSPKQADLFITQQCNLLEYNELRALPPKELQKKLCEIIRDNPLNTQAYFLGYMNQIRIRDFNGALDWLHRCFDRSPTQMVSQYELKGFQYFSLNLAVLHASFEHNEEALNALRECIMLAQECGDKRCLELANSWYCLINADHIDPMEKTLPDITDPGLVQSLTQAIQFVVKYGARGAYSPLELFDLLQKSDELNSKSSLLEHVSDSLALRSALWTLYGRYEMASIYAQLLLDLQKTWAFGDVGNAESVCEVMCFLAMWLNAQGETQLSAVIIQHAQDRFKRYPFAKNWMIAKCHIKIEQCMYRRQWTEALQSCCQLYLLDRNASMLHRATVLISKRYFDRARHILDLLLLTKHLEIWVRIRALVLQGYISMSCGHITAETIELLLKASVNASANFMEYDHALIDVALAQALLIIGMPSKALQSVLNGMDRIHANGRLYDQAKTDLVFVKCLLADAEDLKEKTARLKRAIKTLEKAATRFKKLEVHAKVLDVYAFMAKSFNEVGECDLRNKYARHFKLYFNQYPVSREYLENIF